jgi:hypothetical protein
VPDLSDANFFLPTHVIALPAISCLIGVGRAQDHRAEALGLSAWTIVL